MDIINEIITKGSFIEYDVDKPRQWRNDPSIRTPFEVERDKKAMCYEFSMYIASLAKKDNLIYTIIFVEMVSVKRFKNFGYTNHMFPAIKYKGHWYLIDQGSTRVRKYKTLTELFNNGFRPGNPSDVYKILRVVNNFSAKLEQYWNNTSFKYDDLISITGSCFDTLYPRGNDPVELIGDDRYVNEIVYADGSSVLLG